MNRQILLTNFFHKYLQFDVQPLYVVPQTPKQQAQQTPSISTKVIKKKNQFPTLFTALANAQPNSVIKIETGLYKERNQITQEGVRIQINQNQTNAVFVSEQFPTIIIDLPNKDDKVSIQGLKFAHTCKPPRSNLRWPGLRVIRDNRYHPLKVDQSINTSILVRKGVLQIDQCRFSLAAQKDSRHLYPSIVVEEEGYLIVTRSQFTGNAGTVGIYSIGGKVNIRECCFKDHGGMAVWMNGGPQTSLVLKNSVITKCAEGIVLNGPFCSSVENNTITQCSGTGIMTLYGNSSNILNNQVRNCKYGIEVDNSCPKVMKNNLIANKQYGLCSWSRQNGQCWPILRFNLISQNKKGGMLVWGSRNKSEVRNNMVKLNQKVGIRVDSNAHPHIFLNQITATFGNGVHICNGGTSFLEKNLISGSLNCNLVLQGPRNIDNYIYNNRIEGARGQGMFLLHCQKFLIAKNTITNNYNGIVCITSVVNIEDNTISNNKSNGVMLLDDCQILLSENQFQGNRKAGFVSRRTSRAKMRMNRFEDNNIEALAQNGWEGIEDVEEDNEFKDYADIRTPGKLGCQLI